MATSLNNLALAYEYQGRLSEAEPLLNRSLAILEKTLPPDDPLIANILNNSGGLYRRQERFADAEEYYKRSLAIREKNSNPIDIAESYNNSLNCIGSWVAVQRPSPCSSKRLPSTKNYSGLRILVPVALSTTLASSTALRGGTLKQLHC